MWHCPHCGAPQAETARCWVCRRSSTTCSTCRHFRSSLATDVGYCALDRRRRPLTGAELRGCWSERPVTGTASGPEPAETPGRAETAPGLDPEGRLPVRTFVPVEAFMPVDTVEVIPELVASPALLSIDSTDAWEARTSLFGDADR